MLAKITVSKAIAVLIDGDQCDDKHVDAGEVGIRGWGLINKWPNPATSACASARAIGQNSRGRKPHVGWLSPPTSHIFTFVRKESLHQM
jgi:hypothetical protein